MKKIILSIIATTMFIALFSSCQKTDDSSSGNEEQSSDTVVIENVPPDNRKDYDYISYDELLTALIKSNSKEYKELRSEEEKYGKAYQATLQAFSSGKIDLYIPKMNGREMQLRERVKEGFSNITFFTSEVHNLPSIWYHCKYNDEDIIFMICYPSVLSNSESFKNGSVVDVLKVISPDAPMPSNADTYKSKYPDSTLKNAYEKDIVLSDANINSALVREYDDTNRIYVSFTIDNALVTIRADAKVLTNEFWKEFSVSKY